MKFLPIAILIKNLPEIGKYPVIVPQKHLIRNIK